MTSNPGFGAYTEGNEVVQAFSAHVKDKIVLITGASIGGLGGETAIIIASQAPRLLILSGRTLTKVVIVKDEISRRYPTVETRAVEMDMSSKASVKKAAAEINAYPENHIDVLINNAGVMNLPNRMLSVDGLEMQLATNWLGHFILTNLLTDKLAAAPMGARVVNISSNGHALSPVRFSDLNFEGKELPEHEKPREAALSAFGISYAPGYLPVVAYGQSKTANILHSVEISNRLKVKGVSAFSLHPGAIATELWRSMDPSWTDQLFQMLPMKTLSQGISTTLVCAFDPKLKESSGAYLEDCQISAATDFATDEAYSQRLWKLGEELST